MLVSVKLIQIKGELMKFEGRGARKGDCFTFSGGNRC